MADEAGAPPPQAYPAIPPEQQVYPPPDQQAYPPPQAEAYPPAQAPGYPQQQAPPPTAAGYPQQQPPPPQQPGYPQAPPAYPPQAQQQQSTTTVVVTQQPVTVQNIVFRDRPVTVTDSNGQQVQTVLEYRSGALTWIACVVACLILLECGLCCFGLIPFCISATKDVYHITPTDRKVVGVYKRL